MKAKEFETKMFTLVEKYEQSQGITIQEVRVNFNITNVSTVGQRPSFIKCGEINYTIKTTQ